MKRGMLFCPRKAVLVGLVAFTMVLMFASQALALVVQVDNPDPAYLARTSKFDVSGFSSFSSVGGLSDGTRVLTFSQPVIKLRCNPVDGDIRKLWGNAGEVEETSAGVLYTATGSTSMQLDAPVYELGFEASPNQYETPFEVSATFTISNDGTVIDSVSRVLTNRDQTEGNLSARLFAIRSQVPFDKVELTIQGSDLGVIFAQLRYNQSPPPLVAVTGTVKSPAGVGIPFASIQIEHAGDGVADLKADYAGRYTVDLLPGTYTFYVDASGWGGISQQVVVPEPAAPDAGPEFEVAVQGPTSPYDFVLTDHYEQAVYRFFNKYAGVHFYTATDAEFISTFGALSGQFHYDGIAYMVGIGKGEGEVPLYRFYNRGRGVHFYTANEAEKNQVIAEWGDRYTFEGIAYYVRDNGEGIPVYRYYVPSRDTHFYTADTSEISARAGLSKYYYYEGPAFWVGRGGKE